VASASCENLNYCEERRGHLPVISPAVSIYASGLSTVKRNDTFLRGEVIKGVGEGGNCLNVGTTCLARDHVLKYKQEVTAAAICWQKYKANGFTERRGSTAFSRCSAKKLASHGS
jgi:hypothetical protein